MSLGQNYKYKWTMHCPKHSEGKWYKRVDIVILLHVMFVLFIYNVLDLKSAGKPLPK